MEFCKDINKNRKIKAVLCDFDGTFSTLRCGWEGVMRKLMLKVLSNGKDDAELEKTVDRMNKTAKAAHIISEVRVRTEPLEKTGSGKIKRKETKI